ncbi:HEAT repeat domain-containing protein [Candidatus Albibeggiatoa sp. nov. NOAA]|uniref:HEAT repeat domain-containing protein n=1 Tax=Candidatus Albibeggiatoa sp. nov. NOAA TaxID=3162724 RepID=UPI0032FAA953|nr:HEAT repeat domain-containing protein [Thiotrichaceae bacterium]
MDQHTPIDLSVFFETGLFHCRCCGRARIYEINTPAGLKEQKVVCKECGSYPIIEDIPNKVEQRQLCEKLAQDNDYYSHTEHMFALEALGKYWGDQSARDFVIKYITEKKVNQPLNADTFHILACYWPSDKTAGFLSQLLENEQNYATRDDISNALEVCRSKIKQARQECSELDADSQQSADLHNDKQNVSSHNLKQLFTKRIKQRFSVRVNQKGTDTIVEYREHGETRQCVLQPLNLDEHEIEQQEMVRGKATYDLLLQLILIEDTYSLRIAVLEFLAEYWPNEYSRSLVLKYGIQANNSSVRYCSIRRLAKSWPDNKTKQVLYKQLKEEKYDNNRAEILRYIAQFWPSAETQELLYSLAINRDEATTVQSAALECLSRYWDNDKVRQLLQDRVINGDSLQIQQSTLEGLWAAWVRSDKKDEALYQFIDQYIYKNFREGIVYDMLEHRPTEKLYRLLRGRAPFSGAAANAIAEQHSALAGCLFSQVEYVGYGYTDPRDPLEILDFVILFEIADIDFDPNDVDDIDEDELLAPISEYMGWDLTEGSEASDACWQKPEVFDALLLQAEYGSIEHPYDYTDERRYAMKCLVKYWKNDKTKQLLQKLTKDEDVSYTAIDLLEEHWPEEA